MTTTSARERSSRLADLLGREHSAMADFLVELAAFDRERVWERLGYPSLFSFLRRELRLSAGAAQYRKTAAELIQRYPEVEAALRVGRLCLSSVIERGKVVTPDNLVELLPRFFGLSSRDAAAVAVSIRPVQDPPRRELVTVLPIDAGPAAMVEGASSPALPATPSHRGAPFPAPSAFRAPEVADGPPGPGATAPAASAAGRLRPPPVEVEPLSAELRRLHVTVSRRLLDKLEAARAALSHSHPGASTDQVLEVGLDLIIERHARRRGLVKKPRAPKVRPERAEVQAAAQSNRPAEVEAAEMRAHDAGERSASPGPRPSRDSAQANVVGSRRSSRAPIPAHVKRAVWLRDGGRCQWPLESGGVCGSTLRVEIDHIVPIGRGGSSNVDDLECICAFHNQLAARQAYGEAWMERFTGRGRPSAGGPPPRP